MDVPATESTRYLDFGLKTQQKAEAAVQRWLPLIRLLLCFLFVWFVFVWERKITCWPWLASILQCYNWLLYFCYLVIKNENAVGSTMMPRTAWMNLIPRVKNRNFYAFDVTCFSGVTRCFLFDFNERKYLLKVNCGFGSPKCRFFVIAHWTKRCVTCFSAKESNFIFSLNRLCSSWAFVRVFMFILYSSFGRRVRDPSNAKGGIVVWFLVWNNSRQNWSSNSSFVGWWWWTNSSASTEKSELRKLSNFILNWVCRVCFFFREISLVFFLVFLIRF